MLRSVIAVVVGFIFIGLFSFGADFALRSLMPGYFSPDGRVDNTSVLLLMMAYVMVFAVAGCYLTARLAPNKPMKHALILGLLGLIFNVLGTLKMWDTAPAWFHILSLILVMPYAWLGGRLREAQLGRVSPA
jgi:hypothetical protein